MRFQRILCPVDFSPNSDHAVDVAVALAKATNAELVFAHVFFMPLVGEPESPLPQSAIDQMAKNEQSALAELAQRTKDRGVERASTTFLHGVPWDRIVAMLRDDPRFDLVVMGTQGRTGLSRLLIGSVAEKVVRHAPCPVLVTRGSHVGPWKRVLCPTDFSPPSRAAANLAAELVDPQGTVQLTYSIELPVAFDRHREVPEFMRDIDLIAKRQLDEAAAELRTKTNVPVATELRVGSPAAELLAVLDRDRDIDLVVIGSHGRTGLRRVFLGSVAERLVRHAHCSVLVVHARGGMPLAST